MNIQGIIGKKLYQSSGFLENGTRIPLTAIATKGNYITQAKTIEKEGYNSLQLGFESKKKPLKREINHVKKTGINKTPRFLKEFRTEELIENDPGKEIIAAEVFKPGDVIKVTGVSKGKGYAGVVKRHHFKGGPRTHGQSDRERAPGSIGQTTTPGRVYKGKRMAGRMGHETATVKNLQVIKITNEGVLLIKGLIPGGINSIVTVNKTGENKKFIPLYKEIKEDEAKINEVEVKEEIVEEIKDEVNEELKTEIKEDIKEEIEKEKEELPIDKKEIKEENAKS